MTNLYQAYILPTLATAMSQAKDEATRIRIDITFNPGPFEGADGILALAEAVEASPETGDFKRWDYERMNKYGFLATLPLSKIMSLSQDKRIQSMGLGAE